MSPSCEEVTEEVISDVSPFLDGEKTAICLGFATLQPDVQTAQNAHSRQHAYFVSEIGLARAERPPIVLTQHRDHSGSGPDA
jgi:hypothetical protein